MTEVDYLSESGSIPACPPTKMRLRRSFTTRHNGDVSSYKKNKVNMEKTRETSNEPRIWGVPSGK